MLIDPKRPIVIFFRRRWSRWNKLIKTLISRVGSPIALERTHTTRGWGGQADLIFRNCVAFLDSILSTSCKAGSPASRPCLQRRRPLRSAFADHWARCAVLYFAAAPGVAWAGALRQGRLYVYRSNETEREAHQVWEPSILYTRKRAR